MTTSKKAKKLTSQEEKNKRNALIGALFMGVILAVSLLYVYFSGQLETSLEALSNMDGIWILVEAACMLAYLVFGAFAYKVAISAAKLPSIGLINDASVEAAGTFFGNLTPSMVGSFPAQIYKLCQNKCSLGEATGIQIVRFGVYVLVSAVLGLALLLITWPYFVAHYPQAVWLNIVLIVLKMGQLAILVVASLFPHFLIRLAEKFFALLKRLGIAKVAQKADAWLEQLTSQVTLFNRVFRQVITQVKYMLLLVVCSLIQLVLFYATPYFILLAFGLEPSFLIVLTAGTMVQFLANAMPLPGGTGGIEASFAVFFAPLFGGSLATAGYLIWRFVTFYGYTIVCGVMSMVHVSKLNPPTRTTKKARA